MTVASHAQQNQIEAREAAGVALKAVAEKIFVSLGGPAKLRPLRLHAVNVSRRNGNAQQQLGARHSVIAFGIVRRNVAFIAPVQMHLGPIHLEPVLIACQAAVKCARSRAARQRHPENTVPRNRLPGPLHEVPRRRPCHRFRVRTYEHARSNFSREDITDCASVVHRSPIARRIRAGPSFLQDTSESPRRGCRRPTPREWGPPETRRPRRCRRGQTAWHRRAGSRSAAWHRRCESLRRTPYDNKNPWSPCECSSPCREAWRRTKWKCLHRAGCSESAGSPPLPSRGTRRAARCGTESQLRSRAAPGVSRFADKTARRPIASCQYRAWLQQTSPFARPGSRRAPRGTRLAASRRSPRLHIARAPRRAARILR